MRILVTGGSGFIGSHFVSRAMAAGHEVSVLNRQDAADPEKRAVLLEGRDVVYHFAWDSNPVAGWRNPLIEVEGNLRHTIDLCEDCVDAGVKKLVFASSGGTVYGTQTGPITEEVIPEPFNPYGVGKLAAEHFLQYYRKRTELATDIYRIGNAYGPGQRTDRPQGVIALWMNQIMQHGHIEVYGDETTIRDYIHVEDVAQLMLHSLNDLSSSQLYNLGTGVGTSILELLAMFEQTVDRPFTNTVYQQRDLDNTSCILNASRLLEACPDFVFKELQDELGPTWRAFNQQFHA